MNQPSKQEIDEALKFFDAWAVMRDYSEAKKHGIVLRDSYRQEREAREEAEAREVELGDRLQAQYGVNGEYCQRTLAAESKLAEVEKERDESRDAVLAQAIALSSLREQLGRAREVCDTIANELQAWLSTDDPRPASWSVTRIKRLRAVSGETRLIPDPAKIEAAFRLAENDGTAAEREP